MSHPPSVTYRAKTTSIEDEARGYANRAASNSRIRAALPRNTRQREG